MTIHPVVLRKKSKESGLEYTYILYIFYIYIQYMHLYVYSIYIEYNRIEQALVHFSFELITKLIADVNKPKQLDYSQVYTHISQTQI